MTVCMKDKGCMMSTIGFWLIIVGAVNWGLVGIGGFLHQDLNVVHMLLGSWAMVEWAVYVLVGLAGVMMLFGCKCEKCKMSGGQM